jgi:hypothetical protein
VTHEIELLRRRLREGIPARLTEMYGYAVLDEDALEQVIDVAALLMHMTLTRTLDTRVLNLQNEVKDLFRRLGEQRGKAVARAKSATYWEQRFNAAKRQETKMRDQKDYWIKRFNTVSRNYHELRAQVHD